jgi:hypothetical protein
MPQKRPFDICRLYKTAGRVVERWFVPAELVVGTKVGQNGGGDVFCLLLSRACRPVRVFKALLVGVRQKACLTSCHVA